MPASPSSLSMFVDAVTDAEVPEEDLPVAQSIRLLQALSAIPDPRRRRGRRHSLQSILLVAVCAVLAGARIRRDRRPRSFQDRLVWIGAAAG